MLLMSACQGGKFRPHLTIGKAKPSTSLPDSLFAFLDTALGSDPVFGSQVLNIVGYWLYIASRLALVFALFLIGLGRRF